MIAARRHGRMEGMDEAVWRLWMLMNLARLALERLLVPPLILPLLPMAVERADTPFAAACGYRARPPQRAARAVAVTSPDVMGRGGRRDDGRAPICDSSPNPVSAGPRGGRSVNPAVITRPVPCCWPLACMAPGR